VKTGFLLVLVSGLTDHLVSKCSLSIKSAAFIPNNRFQNSFGQAVSGTRVLNCKGHPHELHLSLSGFLNSHTLHTAYLLLCSSSMSLLAIFCFHSKKLVLWLFVLPLQICSLLLVYVSICFLSIIRVCKQFFYFLSISDFFVGTAAVDTAAFKS
jgi:hypothetical protein